MILTGLTFQRRPMAEQNTLRPPRNIRLKPGQQTFRFVRQRALAGQNPLPLAHQANAYGLGNW